MYKRQEQCAALRAKAIHLATGVTEYPCQKMYSVGLDRSLGELTNFFWQRVPTRWAIQNPDRDCGHGVSVEHAPNAAIAGAIFAYANTVAR